MDARHFWRSKERSNKLLAQSAGAVNYTDCFSAVS